MNITIRADASINIGSGHIMRCLVFAEALLAKGHNVEFICREQPGNLINYIRQKSISIKTMRKYPYTPPEQYSTTYEYWLQAPWQEDANEFISLVNEVDLVISDHYAIASEWEKEVINKLDCSILAIDDLDREHHCDFILDQNLWEDMLTRYQSCPGIKFLGPNYALLQQSFAQLRIKKLANKNQVLAFFGGSDLTKECIKLAKAAQSISTLPFTLKIVAGKSNLAIQELLLITKNTDIIIEQFIDNFDIELKQSNYAIGASGVSNWERFCLQIPTSIVSVAENQRVLSEYLSDLGTVRYIGNSDNTTIDRYKEELLYLCSCWPNPPSLKPIFVDGLGAFRIIEKIEEAITG